MTTTKIEWVRDDDGSQGKTWNPVRGCSLVSHGCTNCYAMRQAHRFSGKGQPYEGLVKLTSRGPVWAGNVRLVPELLDSPLRWTKPRRIFVNSMSDLFHEDVPDSFTDQVFAIMALATRHTFLVLTKRPERMCAYLSDGSLYDRLLRAAYTIRADWPGRHALHRVPISDPSRFPLRNVWLGVSAEDQETFEERHRQLLQTPAAVRWLSLEPLLGPIDLELDEIRIALEPDGAGNKAILGGINWVVAGGESGPKARPMHPDWVRSIRDQCQAASVPFFLKQWGEWLPALQEGPEVNGEVEINCSDEPIRVGKKRAGRLLDGRTWDEYPGHS